MSGVGDVLLLVRERLEAGERRLASCASVEVVAELLAAASRRRARPECLPRTSRVCVAPDGISGRMIS